MRTHEGPNETWQAIQHSLQASRRDVLTARVLLVVLLGLLVAVFASGLGSTSNGLAIGIAVVCLAVHSFVPVGRRELVQSLSSLQPQRSSLVNDQVFAALDFVRARPAALRYLSRVLLEAQPGDFRVAEGQLASFYKALYLTRSGWLDLSQIALRRKDEEAKPYLELIVEKTKNNSVASLAQRALASLG